MNLKKTLILGVVLLIAVAYVFWVEMPRQERAENRDVVFHELKEDEIDSIEITRKNENFTLKNTKPSSDSDDSSKDKGDDAKDAEESSKLKHWELATVPGSNLDPGALNTLLSAITDLRTGSALPKEEVEEDLSIYGLKEPEVKLAIKAGAKQIGIELGKENNFLHKRYAKISGFSIESDDEKAPSDIFLISGGLLNAANKARDDFRQRTPIAFADSDVESITLKKQSEQIKIEAANLSWKITEPGKYTGSSAAMSELLRELRSLRALQFIDQEPSTSGFGFEKPELSVAIDFKDDKKQAPLNLQIVKRQENRSDKKGKDTNFYFALSDKPYFFKLASDPTARIAKPLPELREKQLFRFDLNQVNEASFNQADGSKIELVKSGEEWKVNGKNGDEVFVRELLSKLSLLKADDFPQGDNFGFDKPLLKVDIKSLGSVADNANQSSVSAAPDPTLYTLVIGNEVSAMPKEKSAKSKNVKKEATQEKRYFAAVGDLSEPFIINKETFDRIKPKEEVLVKIEPTPVVATSAQSSSP